MLQAYLHEQSLTTDYSIKRCLSGEPCWETPAHEGYRSWELICQKQVLQIAWFPACDVVPE